MKTSIYTSSISRSAGGIFDAVRDLYLKMQSADLQIYSYQDLYTEQDRKQWGNLQLHLSASSNPFQYSLTLKNAILKSDSDLLHVHGLWRFPHYFLGIWNEKKKLPTVSSPHGMLDPYILRSQGIIKRIIGRALFHRAFASVSCFHALCQKEMEDIREYGIKQPVAIIPNGVNLPDSSLIFPKSDDKKHLLFLGRLHPKKGVDLLIKSITVIKKNKPELLKNWVVDIVGWDHENTKESLVNLVKRERLENNIIFHGGLFGQDKLKFLANANAYILPSYGEGLPMTVLEAWSWKVPVLITPQCNLPEGFTVNAAIKIETSIESVVKGLEKLFTLESHTLLEMGNNGYTLVQNNFTWEKSAEKMQKLYQWLLHQTPKPNFVYTE